MNEPVTLSIADLNADLDINEAELAAGDIVPGEEILFELRASLARLEAKRRGIQHREVPPHR